MQNLPIPDDGIETLSRGLTRRTFGGALGAALVTGSSTRAVAAQPLRLRRGINLWPWFALTREFPAPRTDYGWPAFQDQRPVPTPGDLARLARAGFDFVRLPVDPGPFLALSGPHRGALIASLDRAIEDIRSAGLSLVLNIHANSATHHYNPANLYGHADAPEFPAYRGFVAELARRFGHRRGIALEPVNEPPQGCGSMGWIEIQASLLRTAREIAPDLTLVVTGACGSMIPGLTALDPAPLQVFAPILFTVHFYEPYLFTHQGAPWMSEPVYRALNNVPWPGSAGTLERTLASVRARMGSDPDRTQAEKEAAYQVTRSRLAEYFAAAPDRRFIDRQFVPLRDWAKRHAIAPERIVIGEFGALRTDARYVAAGRADRLRYLRDVRESAEAFGFPWALWNLFDGMGLLDDLTHEPDDALLVALGLNPR